MPGSIVQSKEGTGASVGSVSATFDSATTTGNAIAVFVASRNPSGSTLSFSISDNKGNTYSLGSEGFTGGGDFARATGVWYVNNSVGGSSHQITATLGSGTADIAIIVGEVTGVLTSAFDRAVNAANIFADPVTSPTTGTLAQARSFLLAYNATGASTMAPGGSWVEYFEGAPALGFPARHSLMYQSVNSTGAVSNNCDLDAANNGAAAILVFKETEPPPVITPFYNLFPKTMLRY